MNLFKNDPYTNVFFHRKRKYYVGDFGEDDIESPNSRHEFWNASKRTIHTQQRKIKSLRKKTYRLREKISNMAQLIDHLSSEMKIDKICFSFLKVVLIIIIYI